MGRVVINGLRAEQVGFLVAELRHRSDLGSVTYELGGDEAAADAVAFPAQRASLDSDELRKAVERLVQTVQADHDSERTGVCHDPASALALREVRALLSAGDKAEAPK